MDAYTPLFAFIRPGLEHVKIAIECDVPSTSKSHEQVELIGSKEEFQPQKRVGDSGDEAADERASPHSLTSTSSQTSLRNATDSAPPQQQQLPDTRANRRIFALVTNVEQGYEQGCILVLKRTRRDPNRVKIVDGLPVLPAFSASVRQIAADAAQHDMRTSIPGQASSEGYKTPSASSSRLQLDMTLAGKTISAVSDDAQAIRDMLKVVRDVTKEAQASTDGQTHTWVEHYMDVDRSATGAQTPIFSRFTTSSIAPSRPLRARAASPTSDDEVKISFATFNVNGQLPTGSSKLQDWLHVSDDDPDILVVALQEADSSGLSYLVWTPQVEAAWTEAIEHSMQRSMSEYTKLTSKQLVGLITFVYVKISQLPRIRSPAVSSVGTGFGGWAANKGAVGVRFALDGTAICFVNSHLSAFHTPEALERRRWDHHEIVRRLKFVFLEDDEEDKAQEKSINAAVDQQEDERGAVEAKATAAVALLRAQLERSSSLGMQEEEESSARSSVSSSSSDVEEERERGIVIHRTRVLDHDVVFWGGDLNFRIDLSTLETKRLIRRGQFEQTLLKFDQLRGELSSKASFTGFAEQSIDFAPTYKFDRGTDTYDTSEKQRCPAWTDRVLFYERPLDTAATGQQDNRQKLIQPIQYESAPSIRLSDHKPVLATFLLRLPNTKTA